MSSSNRKRSENSTASNKRPPVVSSTSSSGSRSSSSLNRGGTARVLPPPPPPPPKGNSAATAAAASTSENDGNAIANADVLDSSTAAGSALVSSGGYMMSSRSSQGTAQHHHHVHEYFSSSSSSEDEEFLDEEDLMSEFSYPSMHTGTHTQQLLEMTEGTFMDVDVFPGGGDYQSDEGVDIPFHATTEKHVIAEADAVVAEQHALQDAHQQVQDEDGDMSSSTLVLQNGRKQEQQIIENPIEKGISGQEDLFGGNKDPSFPVVLSAVRDIDVDSILNEEEEMSLSQSDHDASGAQNASERAAGDVNLGNSVLNRANKDVLEEILAEQEDEYASSVANSVASSISATGSLFPEKTGAETILDQEFHSIETGEVDDAQLTDGLSKDHIESLENHVILAEDEENNDDASPYPNIVESRIHDDDDGLYLSQRSDGADPFAAIGTGLEGLTDVIEADKCASDADVVDAPQQTGILPTKDCDFREKGEPEYCDSTDNYSGSENLKHRDDNNEVICGTSESSLPHSQITGEDFEPSPCVSEDIDVAAMENFFVPKMQEDEPKLESSERILEDKEHAQEPDNISANALTGKQKSVKSNQPPVPRALPSLRTSKSQGAHISKHAYDDISSGMLPDALILMRQKIESMSLFDSDMMRLAAGDDDDDFDEDYKASKESLKRSFQQSISAAVLVSLAHKRYERRRLAAMEIEKVVRSLVQQNELDRVRAILLLLSDDYVRSANEDARKGGVVALAACAIGLKKADESNSDIVECKDLILASVVHSCQDHSQRVRYYATESLFNVIKVIPALAVQHFFILFEILRSLYADVDHDVRSGAQLLDKKLKEVIIMATNNGSFAFETCVPLFTRFVYMTNKPTKRLTLTWLQEFVEKLVGSPILEFLHLFLGGVFDMLADVNAPIRQLALTFLDTVLPKLEVNSDDLEFEVASASSVADFDKIIQSLVTTMEHPDPLVRKVAMYWMSRIVRAHIDGDYPETPADETEGKLEAKRAGNANETGASISVRNSFPHVLPGILLSIGDTYDAEQSNIDNVYLPNQSTRALADQTNLCLQNAIRQDGSVFVSHLDGFIVALREELDSLGGLGAKNAPAVERKPYRMDANADGTGIETAGWFRTSKNETSMNDEDNLISRLCALQWVTVLYENVVPDELKAEYAKKFISPIIHQLVASPPDVIVFKSFEVLANITVPQESETKLTEARSKVEREGETKDANENSISGGLSLEFGQPVNVNVALALEVLDHPRRQFSRDREVFAAIINLYSYHTHLLPDLPKVVRHMCTLQPPEFVYLSFAVELDVFILKKKAQKHECTRDLEFVSMFVQQISHVCFTSRETLEFRNSVLMNCIGENSQSERDERKRLLFSILLHSFAHNLTATLTLCLWGAAFHTASIVLHSLNRMEINLRFLLEVDMLVELLERPPFRHLHLRLLQGDEDSSVEGSGSMLFRALKSLLMLLPQGNTFTTLKNRLTSAANFRKSTFIFEQLSAKRGGTETRDFVDRILKVRNMHNDAKWMLLRAESLEPVIIEREFTVDADEGRRNWVGYNNAAEESKMKEELRRMKKGHIPKSTTDCEAGVYKQLPALPDIDEERGANAIDVSKTLLRHPDGVFAKDFANNGIVHQVRSSNRAEISDFESQKNGTPANDMNTEGSEHGKGWKDFWTNEKT
mmetsp:Transcript_8313/g.12314  ORF Transcript_8313/g.12314 Transcript_8313/m.12314 type:complete len:1668 (+) Transcript_8313:74-5077(+)